ncbi:MAG: hypothetical protein JNL06_03835 [Alphaproteobacteria bacterium]|nr:hypothetical protein [Alphaproteobacteria bacterium]
MSKAEAGKAWAKLDKAGHLVEQPKMLAAVAAYRRFLAEQSKNRKEPHPAAHAATWLNQRRFDGFLESQVVTQSVPGATEAPGWEAAFPKWANIRAYFRKIHGNDLVWQNMFGGCRALSETELVVPSRFLRDQLAEKFGDKIAGIIGADVSFRFEPPQAAH